MVSIATVFICTQLGHGMNLPIKFHRNRPCINGALDRTDIHTDKHIDGKSENKGRLKKKKIFFFRLYRLPNIQTDGKTENNGSLATTQQTTQPLLGRG